ncbi:MAG TPA: helix-turn-helix domain-containing protein [Methylophilaceae bacterium]
MGLAFRIHLAYIWHMPGNDGQSNETTGTPRPKLAQPSASLPLATIRKLQGLTLDDVAERINSTREFARPVLRGTICAIERGHRGSSPRMLAAIARALGIDPRSVTNSKPHKGGDVSTVSTEKLLYTADEAAELLSMSRRRLDELRRAGDILAVRDGRSFKFRRDDLIEYASRLPAYEPA